MKGLVSYIATMYIMFRPHRHEQHQAHNATFCFFLGDALHGLTTSDLASFSCSSSSARSRGCSIFSLDSSLPSSTSSSPSYINAYFARQVAYKEYLCHVQFFHGKRTVHLDLEKFKSPDITREQL